MPEIQNTFIKSKMNKDLDDRLLSKGEYRNAQNVNISRSEGEDVGSLENVLGNKIASSLMASVQQELLGFGVVVIGFFEDDTNKCVYTFLTNYSDPFLGQQTQAPYGSEHYIVKTDLKNITDLSYENSQILVRGSFLNFSQTNPIYGVNLIEDLLFWTDNRNQPRKINVKLAISVLDPGPFEPPKPGIYYTNEDQISVAKFYPSEVPKIFNEVNVQVTDDDGPDPITGDYKNFVTIADAKKLKGGMALSKGASGVITDETYIIAVAVTASNSTSYFLTNKRVATSFPISVPFGFSGCENQAKEYLDYSIVGSVFREDDAVSVEPAPLNIQEIINPTTTRSSDFIQSGSNVTAGTYSTSNSTLSFTVVDVNGASKTIAVTPIINITAVSPTPSFPNNIYKVEITAGGEGFEIADTITFDFTGQTGKSLDWTLIDTDLATINPPSGKIFFWSGSSIPYTKMKVDVPGFVAATEPNFITNSNFIGVFGGDNYYEIQTQYDHNITPVSVTTPNAVAIAEFSWPNPDFSTEVASTNQSVFAGDEDFLKDKFVRFAYRFKFDDGEYSLISPFTQPAFIPKQRGFIQDGVSLVSTGVGESAEGNSNVTGTPFQRFATGEEDIQASSIVSFFENSIDTVNLKITMPYPLNSLKSKLNVIEIDIIYKESDALVMKVIDTIPEEIFKNKQNSSSLNYTNIFDYSYESKEPFKLVSQKNEILRVSDKVPVRAFSQETSGGRIIYGNFIDKHTSPNSLNYNVRITEKKAPTTTTLPVVNPTLTADLGVVPSSSFLSYPTHTLKQNRTYQVGFVLSDRYGRQSDVILGPASNDQYYIGNNKYDIDTVFNPYFDTIGGTDPNIATWKGDMLEVLLREAIPETISQEGYPGLYNSGEYVMNVASNQSGSTTITFTSIDPRIKVGDIFTPISSNVVSTVTSIVIAINLSLNQITFNNSVTVGPNATTVDNVFINNTGIINGDSNVLGWYSYKMVVKQLTQEYYNAYLGNVSYLSPDAALSTTVGNYPFSGSSFVTSLVADNVNKIPADLTKVAPEQQQFGTSDALLYPRVGGTILSDSANPYIYATNFVFGTEKASINAYGKIQDIGVAELAFNSATPPVPTGFKTPIQSSGVQAASSNPAAIILSMPNGQQIGRQFWKPPGLYVFEVGALQSKIEIFWETSTCGLISDLNKSFSEGPTPVVAVASVPTTPSGPADGRPVQ